MTVSIKVGIVSRPLPVSVSHYEKADLDIFGRNIAVGDKIGYIRCYLVIAEPVCKIGEAVAVSHKVLLIGGGIALSPRVVNYLKGDVS